MIYLLIIIFLINAVLTYITVNLLLKVEKLEDLLDEKDIYISNINNIVDESTKRIKAIDDKGLFSSDDEVGFFFQNIKLIQEYLDKWRNLNTVENTVSTVVEEPVINYTFSSTKDLSDFVSDITLQSDQNKLLFLLKELNVENMYTDWDKLPTTTKLQIFNNWIDLKSSALNLEEKK